MQDLSNFSMTDYESFRLSWPTENVLATILRKSHFSSEIAENSRGATVQYIFGIHHDISLLLPTEYVIIFYEWISVFCSMCSLLCFHQLHSPQVRCRHVSYLPHISTLFSFFPLPPDMATLKCVLNIGYISLFFTSADNIFAIITLFFFTHLVLPLRLF